MGERYLPRRPAVLPDRHDAPRRLFWQLHSAPPARAFPRGRLHPELYPSAHHFPSFASTFLGFVLAYEHMNKAYASSFSNILLAFEGTHTSASRAFRAPATAGRPGCGLGPAARLLGLRGGRHHAHWRSAAQLPPLAGLSVPAGSGAGTPYSAMSRQRNTLPLGVGQYFVADRGCTPARPDCSSPTFHLGALPKAGTRPLLTSRPSVRAPPDSTS